MAKYYPKNQNTTKMTFYTMIETMINNRVEQFINRLCCEYDMDKEYMKKTWKEIVDDENEYDYEQYSSDDSDSDDESNKPIKKSGSPSKKTIAPTPMCDSDSEEEEEEEEEIKPVNKTLPKTLHKPSSNPAPKIKVQEPASDSEEEEDVKPLKKTEIKGKKPREDDIDEKASKKSKKDEEPGLCPYVYARAPRKGEQCDVKTKDSGFCSKHKNLTEKDESKEKNVMPKPVNIAEKPEAEKVDKKLILRKNNDIDKFWHPESKLVFKSASEKTVIGRVHNNVIIKLRPSDIELVKEYRFQYDPKCVAEDEDEDMEDLVEKMSKNKVSTPVSTPVATKPNILGKISLSKSGEAAAATKSTLASKIKKAEEKKEMVKTLVKDIQPEPHVEPEQDISDILDEIQDEEEELDEE
jgi:hypothetical protein